MILAGMTLFVNIGSRVIIRFHNSMDTTVHCIPESLVCLKNCFINVGKIKHFNWFYFLSQHFQFFVKSNYFNKIRNQWFNWNWYIRYVVRTRQLGRRHESTCIFDVITKQNIYYIVSYKIIYQVGLFTLQNCCVSCSLKYFSLKVVFLFFLVLFLL